MGALVMMLPWVVSPPVVGGAQLSWPGMLTWAGVIVTVLVLLLSGRLIPKSTHEREIGLLEGQLAAQAELYSERLAEKSAEVAEWRAATTAERHIAQEERGQKRLLLETQRTTTYALEQLRLGFEQAAQKDVNP